MGQLMTIHPSWRHGSRSSLCSLNDTLSTLLLSSVSHDSHCDSSFSCCRHTIPDRNSSRQRGLTLPHTWGCGSLRQKEGTQEGLSLWWWKPAAAFSHFGGSRSSELESESEKKKCHPRHTDSNLLLLTEPQGLYNVP